MKIFPPDTMNFSTELTKVQLIEKLNEVVDINDNDCYKKSISKKYHGKIHDTGFEIRRKIKYRNSFLPEITGTFHESNNKVEIEVEMAQRTSVHIFFIVWCMFALFAFIASLRASLLESSFDPVIMLILFSVLFVYGIIYIGHKYESTKSSDDLTEIIKKFNSC